MSKVKKAFTAKTLPVLLSLAILFTMFMGMGTITVSAISEWAPNTWYNVNDLVTYQGPTYKCIQAHTSLVGWEPPVVPALWGIQTGTPAPTATPTPPATSTPTPTATPIGTATPTATPTGTATPTPTATPTGTATPTPTATPTATPTPTAPPAAARMYVGYSGTWNTSIYDLTTTNIPNYFTHINLAFAKPNTTYVRGSKAFDQSVAGFEFVEGAMTGGGVQKYFTAQQSQDLINNIAALKARGTQVWVSVGGWSYSQSSAWSSFNAPRVVDLALDLGASGIDIDWESSGSLANKLPEPNFACTKDAEIKGIVSSLYNEIQSRGVNLKISVAGWSTGAYYVGGTPFEEGKVQWGSPYGGTMYRVVKDNGYMLSHVNLMSYDAGDYYDPREGYEAYKAIFNGPINMGMEIAPEGAGGAILEVNAPGGTVYDAEMLTGQNNIATQYYNVETMVKYIKYKGRSFDGFMIWQIWKERVYAPAPGGAATANQAGQYVCTNLPLAGNPSQTIPTLPKLFP